MPLDAHLFQLYLLAAVVLVLIPGPDTLLVLSRSLAEGRAAGLISTAGITIGNIVQAALAAAGVSALIAATPWLFDTFRLAGAAYLAWLGARALIGAAQSWRGGDGLVLPQSGGAHGQAGDSARRTFVRALMTNLLNAKVILFYLAFVPQFVSPAAGSVALQTLILGLVLTFMGTLYLGGVAVLAAASARWVIGNRHFRTALDAVAGLLFLGFAARLFWSARQQGA